MSDFEASENDSRPTWRPSLFLCASLGLHAVALGVGLLAPRQRSAMAKAVFANHVAISLAGIWPRSRLLGHNYFRMESSKNAVALTFDDGPDPAVTPQVLDLLDHHGARASFFLIGRRAERYPDLTQEIVQRGHVLENHTYRHSNHFAFCGPTTLGFEIDRTQEILGRLAGRRPRFFRAPAGIRNPWLDPLLHRRGLTLTSWTHRGFDTVERSPERVVRRLLHRVSAGDILLLHDGNCARTRRGRPVVLEALPQLLEALARRKLRCQPIEIKTTVQGPLRAPGVRPPSGVASRG